MAEMPYYCADGREIFERGNGFMYCNPYDPDPAAPVIYFHWLLWLLGFMTMKLHISPGMATVATGAVAGVVCAWLTFRLVEAILPSRRWLGLCYLAVMWGGGLLVAAAGVANLCTGQQLVVNLLRFDPFEGCWFLNWGRNLVLPNETVYHALVAWCWLAVVRDRQWPAVAAVTALAATHPFSGVQHLLVLGAWLVFQRPRSLVSAAPLVAVAAGLAVLDNATFIAYQWNQPWAYHQDVRVSRSMRAAFGVLERTRLRGTAVVVKPAGDEWEDYSYLLATYTGMTPLLGHPHISPIVREATAEVRAWQETGAVSPRLATVEAMIVPIDFPQARLPGGAAGWQTLARCGTVRVVASRNANPPCVGE